MTTSRRLRILELRSVRGTGGGPEKTILSGAARTSSDCAVTVCYIRDRRDDVFALDRTAAALGVDYVEVHERHSLDPGIWPQIRRLIRERDIDIVHAHDYKTDVLALTAARAEGIIPIATAHGWTGQSVRERWLYYPIDRRLLARFPHVIAVSSDIAREMIACGASPDRVTTILNGVDTERFCRRPGLVVPARLSLGVPPGASVVGSVGRLERQKRFDLLIDAVAFLRGEGRDDLHLVLVGDGAIAPDLRRRAADCGILDACTFAGHRTDVVEVLHAFDVFVQSSEYEGTPNCVLEAMSVEVPVVATSVGGTAELLSDGVHGLLVPDRDPRALVAAIARALDDPRASAERAAAARQHVERALSFDIRMRKVERIYQYLFEAALAHQRVAPSAHGTDADPLR
jgi:glycosyltransferase involved in cell wall biosynthesis